MFVSLATLLLALSPADSAPVSSIRQLVHTRWTIQDGAPADIRQLAQTRDGYLWLGTTSGLVRFDGVRFVRSRVRGSDTPIGAIVARMLASRDGSLWVAWAGGMVSRLQDGRSTTYGTSEGLPGTFWLAEDSKGLVVAGTAKGLSVFADGKWNDKTEAWGFTGHQSRVVWFDQQGTLWTVTESGVMYLPPGATRFVDTGYRLLDGFTFGEFAQATDGQIWLTEMSRSVHTVPRAGELGPMTEVMVGAKTALVDQHGSLWIGTMGDGLRRVLDPGLIRGRRIAQFGPAAEQFTGKDGLISDVVEAILEDNEGNIWAASNRGLERFRVPAFTPTVVPGGVRRRMVFADRDSNVWIGTQSIEDLYRVRRGRLEKFSTGMLVTNVVEAPSGALYAIASDGVAQWRSGRFLPVPIDSGAGDLTDITVDPSGVLWIYDGAFGLTQLRGRSLTGVMPLTDPVFPSSVVFSDREGRIWIGLYTRAAVYDKGKVRFFDVGKVYNFFQDRAGRVWGASTSGLIHFQGDGFRRLPPFPGATNPAIYGITEDAQGAAWVVAPLRVLRLPPGELDTLLADSTHVTRFRSFNQQDGLAGQPSTPLYGPLVTRAQDGRIWVAADSGVASINPDALPEDPPPTALIEALRVDGREISPDQALAIPPKGRDLEIDYTSTTLSFPERVHFRYRLDGEDPAWREVSTRRRAYYTGLAPGTYTFHVVAGYEGGPWNETGTTLRFKLLPAWYQTLWFKTMVVLLIGGLSGAMVAVLQRRRHHQAQAAMKGRYEAILTERARIAQDLHDTLIQGFAGVALQLKTAELALPEEPDVAVETMQRVQRLTRESLREARERVWDLRESEPAKEDLPATLETLARQRIAGTRIQLSVLTSGERRRLSRLVEDAALRICREAIGNAIRHGDPARIDLTLDFGSQQLRLEVRDDGRGFRPEEGEAASRNGHFGLSGMKERAGRMGGHCEVEPIQPQGTRVSVVLPLAEG